MNGYAALAVALAAIVAPAARPAELGPPTTTNGERRPAATAPSIQIRVVEPGGFHWSDAAVGSLAATGLTLVVLGVALVRRRQ